MALQKRHVRCWAARLGPIRVRGQSDASPAAHLWPDRAWHVDQTVRLSGWVPQEDGQLLFVDLRDLALTQCVIDVHSPLFETWSRCAWA